MIAASGVKPRRHVRTTVYRLTLFLLLGSATAAGASDQLRPAELTMRADRPLTGSLLRRDVAWSTRIPLNRTYAQLSDDERAVLRGHYEFMNPDDEPPFPREGLGRVVEVIQQAQEKRMASGELKMLVTVGPDGKATRVSAYGKTNDVRMARFVATVLKLTPYKPATCGGKPCTMQYPFYLKLDVTKSTERMGFFARQ